jgi:hypothetical protein
MNNQKNTKSNIGLFLFILLLGLLMYTQKTKNKFDNKRISSISKHSFDNKTSIRINK